MKTPKPKSELLFVAAMEEKARAGIAPTKEEFLKMKGIFIKYAAKRELKIAWAMQYEAHVEFHEAYGNCEICPVECEVDGVVYGLASRPAPPGFSIVRELPIIVRFTTEAALTEHIRKCEEEEAIQQALA